MSQDRAPAAFTPVATRRREDGWTAEKQVAFIEALAECACVSEACARVGMSRQAAYALRREPNAQSFRLAWRAAMDQGVERLADSAFSRAINGVATPVFFKGEQVGERRRYDERLTMFLLRYRLADRYGAWLDSMQALRHPDGAAMTLAHAIDNLSSDAHLDDLGLLRMPWHTVPAVAPRVGAEAEAAEARRQEAVEEAWEAAEHARLDRLAEARAREEADEED